MLEQTKYNEKSQVSDEEVCLLNIYCDLRSLSDDRICSQITSSVILNLKC